MKEILILGAGLVARPAVCYLLEKGGLKVVLADQEVDKAEAIINGHTNGRAVRMDVKDETMLAQQVSEADIVVSLLPWTLHPVIARLCLAHGKHLVTASYVKDEMQAFDAPAREKDLVFLNEVGVDPGLDHMSAMKIIDEVKSEGGRIETRYSGIVCPAHNDHA